MGQFGHWSSKYYFSDFRQGANTWAIYPTNTKFLKKELFNPEVLIHFRNSLKISLSEDSWCSRNKQKNLPRAQCAPPWQIGLRCLKHIPKKIKALSCNHQPHYSSNFRKAVMKTVELKNKANRSKNLAHIANYKKQRNWVVPLNR